MNAAPLWEKEFKTAKQKNNNQNNNNNNNQNNDNINHNHNHALAKITINLHSKLSKKKSLLHPAELSIYHLYHSQYNVSSYIIPSFLSITEIENIFKDTSIPIPSKPSSLSSSIISPLLTLQDYYNGNSNTIYCFQLGTLLYEQLLLLKIIDYNATYIYPNYPPSNQQNNNNNMNDNKSIRTLCYRNINHISILKKKLKLDSISMLLGNNRYKSLDLIQKRLYILSGKILKPKYNNYINNGVELYYSLGSSLSLSYRSQINIPVQSCSNNPYVMQPIYTAFIFTHIPKNNNEYCDYIHQYMRDNNGEFPLYINYTDIYIKENPNYRAPNISCDNTVPIQYPEHAGNQKQNSILFIGFFSLLLCCFCCVCSVWWYLFSLHWYTSVTISRYNVIN